MVHRRWRRQDNIIMIVTCGTTEGYIVQHGEIVCLYFNANINDTIFKTELKNI